MTRRLSGREVRARIDALDPVVDADEISRLSLVTLHGHSTLVYALFTVAFLKQVAVPTMARTLYRRGTGDIVQQTLQRNDDTIVFFGRLLDHGPDSPTGRAWIDRLNEIHAHFPLRNQDSLYTLATLALDPESITAGHGVAPFSSAELEATWRFWRAVAVRQHIEDIPSSRAELAAWALAYEEREYASTHDGREIAAALVRAFGERCLPRPLRRVDAQVVAALSPPHLREVHHLPEPHRFVQALVRVALRAYARSVDLRRVPVGRSLAADFGPRPVDQRPPSEVGYQRRGVETAHRPLPDRTGPA